MKITTRNTDKSNIEKEALWVKKFKKKSKCLGVSHLKNKTNIVNYI